MFYSSKVFVPQLFLRDEKSRISRHIERTLQLVYCHLFCFNPLMLAAAKNQPDIFDESMQKKA